LRAFSLVETKEFIDREVPTYDNQFVALKDDAGNPVREMGKDIYFRNISPEQQASLEAAPDKSVYLFNTELFQSVNPFWVIVLTPVLVGVFMFLRRRGKEPTTPSKIVIGLFISALSCLVMVGAVYAGGNGLEKVSSWWLIAAYGVITVGEL